MIKLTLPLLPQVFILYLLYINIEGIVLLMNEDTSKTIQNIISNPYSNPVIPSNPSTNSIIL